MKLVTFAVKTPIGTFRRVGALHGDAGSTIIDLNLAHTAMLADRKEVQPYRLSGAMVPPTMLELLEGGPSAMQAARDALAFGTDRGDKLQGPEGETVFHATSAVRILAPLPNPTTI